RVVWLFLDIYCHYSANATRAKSIIISSNLPEGASDDLDTRTSRRNAPPRRAWRPLDGQFQPDRSRSEACAEILLIVRARRARGRQCPRPLHSGQCPPLGLDNRRTTKAIEPFVVRRVRRRLRTIQAAYREAGAEAGRSASGLWLERALAARPQWHADR